VSKAEILVVDDEENIRFVVASALRLAGYSVTEESTGGAALRALSGQETRWDLAILDVMLPDFDGFELTERLRRIGVDTPIVFLTARDTAVDRLRGLTIGGDDYLSKPFSIEELVARVTIILRRMGKVAQSKLLSVAGISLDGDAHLVRLDGEVVPLSPTEYRLLAYLLENEGIALNRSQIVDRVWEYDFDGEPTVVESFVSSLRRKLDPDGILLHTVRGIGYRMGG
jgi:two-component system OmpR family response regulator